MHSNNPAMIIPNLTNHYYSEMLNRILLTYEQFGYSFLVFIGNENEPCKYFLKPFDQTIRYLTG